jgi:ATP-binding cassette subfamily F protein uup
VEIGTTIHFGYFDQHSDDLAEHGNQRVIDYLKDVAELVKTSDGSIITASQMLERFLFPGNTQYAPINKLSGGEKRRLFLLKVLMAAPNVLILDEPTNDLDVQTLAVLEEYLEEFNGCVIVVSHDRYFLDRTVEMVFSFEAEGEVRLYPGNYSIYLEYKKDEAEKESSDAKEQAANKATKEQKSSNIAPSAPETAKSKVESKKTSQLSYKEKREYEELEAKIPKLEAEKTQIEKNLYHNPPSGHTELQKLSARLAELTMEINTSTERWLELAERI